MKIKNKNDHQSGWRAAFARVSRPVTLTALSVALFSSTAAVPAYAGQGTDRLNEVLDILQKNHINKATENELSDAAIEGMIDSLEDPYTEYFSEEDYNEFLNAVGNEYAGIGIRLGEDSRGVYVVQVIPDSPAERKGMHRGERILSVNGKPTGTMSVDDVRDALQGLKGSSVKLRVQGEEAKSTRLLEIKRDTVKLPVVESRYFGNGIGYLALTTFSEDAETAFSMKLKALQEKGLDSLILDLRDNTGGYVDTAAQIAKHFIKEGVLMHSRDVKGKDDPILITGGTKADFKVTLLVNELTASASEILAGALQDYGIAKAVGTRTFGKGVVQNIWKLDNGGYLKVTFEEYFTPDQRKVHHVGIRPDVTVEGSVPQLIKALQIAGGLNLDLTIGNDTVTLNGAEFLGTFDVIHKGGKVFVPAKVLAALVNGKTEWNAKKNSLSVSNGSNYFQGKQGSKSIAMDNGISYIELNAFKAVFRQLSWSQNSKGVRLLITKGN
ncbi:S41 family peptidase [Paenibacillus gansuensis]|uniref:S41 family peptidase n=1 Tax=Paenibacillus gansuensis TaxID=306542 RepID=A0ABW5PAZ8_9BACL